MQMVLFQAGSLYFRLGLAARCYPLKTFSIPAAVNFYGEDSTQARDAARAVLGDCHIVGTVLAPGNWLLEPVLLVTFCLGALLGTHCWPWFRT